MTGRCPKTARSKDFRKIGFRLAKKISSQPRYDHFDNPPCIFQSAFYSKNFWREKQERTLKNIRFLILKALINRGFSGGRNDQVAVKFRVSPVMTASIRLHMLILCFKQPHTSKIQINSLLAKSPTSIFYLLNYLLSSQK